jgi:hypothetical protein
LPHLKAAHISIETILKFRIPLSASIKNEYTSAIAVGLEVPLR